MAPETTGIDLSPALFHNSAPILCKISTVPHRDPDRRRTHAVQGPSNDLARARSHTAKGTRLNDRYWINISTKFCFPWGSKHKDIPSDFINTAHYATARSSRTAVTAERSVMLCASVLCFIQCEAHDKRRGSTAVR